MDMTAFLTLHKDLPREGPGEPDDVAWACALAGVPRAARICDAGCGPGADIPALLGAAPEGHVTAIDKYFAEEARAAHGGDPRVTVREGDMAAPGGPYDFIWCAGALYFLGVTEGLRAWREVLAPGGAVAFSEPCWFTEAPQESAFWGGYDTGTEAMIAARVAEAGYRILGTRPLSDAAWEAYYTPMERRIAALEEGASPDLEAVLEEGRREMAQWRAMRAETGYLLLVVRPE